MFRLTRLPLRRCLHTAAGPRTRQFSRAGIALGASAVATYFAWRTTYTPIALDAPASEPLSWTKKNS